MIYNRDRKKLDIGINDINLRKQELEAQIQQFESFEKSLEASKNRNQSFEEFIEDDALMINDYQDSELNESTVNLSDNEKRMKMEEISNTIKLMMNENLIVDNLLSDISNGTIKVDELNLDSLDITVEEPVETNQEICSLDLVDYTHFKMETELCENFSFRKNVKCFITFSFIEKTQFRNINDSKNLHKYLKIEIYDSHKNPVSFELKEKVNPGIHFIRIYFIPQSIGIFKLHINFKNKEIPNSPFHFVVMNEYLQQQSLSTNTVHTGSSNCVSNFASDGYPAHNDSSIDASLFAPPIKRTELMQNNDEPMLPSLNVGRGRLLKTYRANNGNDSQFWNKSSTETTFSLSPAYKRKSPETNTDLNNNNHNQFSNEELMDVENGNEFNKIPKLSSAHNLIKTNQKNVYFDYQINSGSNLNTNFLSSYLERFSDRAKKWNFDQIPPLKAQFQRKFSNLSYPIGLRSCGMRNWLIVCDNGSNSIKVFEKTTGELIKQIKEDNLVKLRRPSAVLLCERKSEMYVKDDKEIFVFGLEQDFKLKRKFGSKILSKPYGLAYDEQENIVCVDADLRNPLIHIFDKDSGSLISSKPFHPTMKLYANAHILNQRFSQSGNLSQRMQPFDKTKVRFICSNNNFVYASDLGRSIVYKTNLDGSIELAFGFHGKKKGELFEPSGIFVDQDGQAILVGDSKNDRLQVLIDLNFFISNFNSYFRCMIKMENINAI